MIGGEKPKETRSLQLKVRITPRDRARVQALAKHHGRSVANLVRWLVDREWERTRP